MSDNSKHYIVDSFSPSILIRNEQHLVDKNKEILLNYIPDSLLPFSILGLTQIQYDQELTSVNQYKVNYNIGSIILHPNFEGVSINIARYYGCGLLKYYSNRIVFSDGTSIEDLRNTINVPISSFSFFNNGFICSYQNGSIEKFTYTIDSNGSISTITNKSTGNTIQIGYYDKPIPLT